MRYFFAVFMLFISTSTLFAQLTAVKLFDWKHEGLPSSGSWTISEDSTSVRQSKNDVPTFFVSPDTFSNVTIRGSFFVEVVMTTISVLYLATYAPTQQKNILTFT